MVIGCIAAVITLLLLDNKKFPAGLIVVAAGFAADLAPGARVDFGDGGIGFHLPELFGLDTEMGQTIGLMK